MQLWNYLNGKKTLIGAVIFFVAVQLQANGLVDAGTLGQLDKWTEGLASILTIVGLVHKGWKFVKA